MATKKDTASVVELPEIKLKSFTLQIVGDTPLICHAWSKKAKQELLHKQLKKAAEAKEVRRPMVDFAESLYWLTEKPNFDNLTDEQAAEILADIIPKSKFGFPTTAFKSAALDAGFQQGALASKAGTGALAKTTARGAIRVRNEFAIIDGTPTPREDVTKIGMGTAFLCYRAEFKTWRTELQIDFNANVVTVEQIANLFKLGGFANGVGEWRPARDGIYGTFHVE